jgi:hypothetical protein
MKVHSEEAVALFTDIIYCFGIPNCMITDNGTQFTGKKFLNFYRKTTWIGPPWCI